MNKRVFPWLMLAATPVLLFLCLCLGASQIGVPDWGTDVGRRILAVRLPRVLAGFVVGASLSCAGVVLQALLRNPLAEPYVLGVSSGAGLGAALAVCSGLAARHVLALPLTAFLLASATLLLVYMLASSGGRLSVYGLILSGVIVSSVCSSILMFIIAFLPAEGLHSVWWWMLGNLEVSSLPLLLACASVVGVGLVGVWALAPELNALALGRDMAHHVGVRTRFAITLGLGLSTLLTAAAVSTAGLIGFVGLVVPHVTRSLTGPAHRRLIPAAALAGGVFLALCDGLARTVMAPVEIPVGVVTALIGGPFFLAILRSRRKRGWIE
jgi:iron complex transport system permease protein